MTVLLKKKSSNVDPLVKELLNLQNKTLEAIKPNIFTFSNFIECINFSISKSQKPAFEYLKKCIVKENFTQEEEENLKIQAKTFQTNLNKKIAFNPLFFISLLSSNKEALSEFILIPYAKAGCNLIEFINIAMQLDSSKNMLDILGIKEQERLLSVNILNIADEVCEKIDQIETPYDYLLKIHSYTLDFTLGLLDNPYSIIGISKDEPEL